MKTNKNIHTDIFQDLADRLGKEHLGNRMYKQINLSTNFYAKTRYASLHLENIEWLPILLRYLLKAFHLYQRGVKNTLEYKITRIQVALENLPHQFNGFSILQLSDIHADALVDEGKTIKTLIKDIKPDAFVLTGDFRFSTQGSYKEALSITKEIKDAAGMQNNVFGILGNHDFIEFVPELESAGIRMLMNEAVCIRKNGSEIWLAGIDDPHLYDCHDIPKSLKNVNENAIRILLAHSPEVYREAEKAGIDYMICGHTHGGQLCLPGGIPVITNAKCPRNFCSGSWRYKKMKGFTSRGTGTSGLPVRFFCPPEIVIHTLVRK